jgi:hypothetical protein
MHDEDWGQRSPRWAGIRSEVVAVQGMNVHLLRADASQSVRAADTVPRASRG